MGERGRWGERLAHGAQLRELALLLGDDLAQAPNGLHRVGHVELEAEHVAQPPLLPEGHDPQLVPEHLAVLAPVAQGHLDVALGRERLAEALQLGAVRRRVLEQGALAPQAVLGRVARHALERLVGVDEREAGLRGVADRDAEVRARQGAGGAQQSLGELDRDGSS